MNKRKTEQPQEYYHFEETKVEQDVRQINQKLAHLETRVSNLELRGSTTVVREIEIFCEDAYKANKLAQILYAERLAAKCIATQHTVIGNGTVLEKDAKGVKLTIITQECHVDSILMQARRLAIHSKDHFVAYSPSKIKPEYEKTVI